MKDAFLTLYTLHFCLMTVLSWSISAALEVLKYVVEQRDVTLGVLSVMVGDAAVVLEIVLAVTVP
jgi:hypothetical protein